MNQLKRKLGPLPLWQWVLIGAVVGIGTVLYRRGHPAAAAAADAASAAVPSDAQYNPLDPTTGLPISGGISTGPATSVTGDPTATQDAFTGYLSNLETLLSLVAPAPDPGPAAETDPAAVATQVGTGRTRRDTVKPKKPKAKKTKTAGAKNPGHHITAHGHNKKTASSSAPHNPRQHHNVQAPSHQRHPATKHPSARTIAVKTGGHGHVPARKKRRR